jgi:hypothetical protein
MLHRIERQKFDNLKSVGSGRVLDGFELVRCEFNGGGLAQYDDPRMSLRVVDARLEGCVVKRCAAHGVVFEEVNMNNATIRPNLNLEACAFKHVVLSGKIGSMMVTPPNHALPAQMRAEFEMGILDFYADVDWALDITRAEFTEADLYYLPGHLIRRDEETQFLLHRDRVKGIDTADLPPYAGVAVSRFEASPFDSLVAVAPRRSKDFEQRLSELSELRRLGVAD